MNGNLICSKCKERPAVIFVSKTDGEDQKPDGLCIQCALEMNIGPIKQMMESMGLTEDDLEAVSEQFSTMFGGEEGFEPGGAPAFPFMTNMISEEKEQESLEEAEEETTTKKKKRRKGRKKPEENKRKFLDAYCTNLTQRATDGKIDAVIGRDKEIYRVLQILSRRTKNNPILIGEPGVGKTAIAEGIALRIVSGDLPAKLRTKELHLLDLTALVAGTQFRGQFESRIKGLVDEVKAAGNIILFIDEVHNLVGTGDAEGSMNAANILKPALSRGEIQVVGATTFNEYRKYIEKDAALERRFQPVTVEEPSIQDSFEMLQGIKSYYEDFHRVVISDYLLRQTVILSERYIHDRFLPDKAIDLLDEACTSANLRNRAISEHELASINLQELKDEMTELEAETEDTDYERIATLRTEIISVEKDEKLLAEKAKDNAVTEEDIVKVINLWTGIPVHKILEGDLKRLAELENVLKMNIIGQDEAVQLVSAAIRRTRVQVSPRRRPASFIFVGPTGVGKTELVKRLADELFDTPETLIRFDMSEFMEKHSVSRIIGSPPGYVGYDEAGQLTEKVRRRPYSVLLFDEIEKAHPDVMNILLQILDEGRITDAQGRTVNFENTVIVMTSNAGSERKEGALGFAKTQADASKEQSLKALGEFLRPEFIGRVDEVVVFRPLSLKDFEKIALLMLGELVESLEEKDIELTWDDNIPTLIAKKAHGGQRGARDLLNIIRREIEDLIATEIVNKYEKMISTIHITGTDEISVIVEE